MYHRNKFQTLLLSYLLCSLLGCSSVLADEAAQKLSASALSTTSAAITWTLPPNVKSLKKRPHDVKVYQFDASPVDNRAPLLMVHGLLGEYWDSFRWRKLVTYLQSDSAFNQRYKVLMVRYDTHLPLAQSVPLFKEAALGVAEAFGQPLNIVALSMGGNVVQDAMRDKEFDKNVRSVITLGTPFHGSPLFTSDWMEYSMLRHYRSPISRLDTTLPYRLYFKRHKNLLADLHWDNSDRMIPDVGKFRFVFPLASKGVLSPESTANTTVYNWNKTGEVDKSKFTVYSGYLVTDYAADKEPSELATLLKVPYRFTFTLLPEHLGREHPVLRALNLHIARAVTNSFNSSPKYVYGLNDGIAPIISSLYLPNSALSGVIALPSTVGKLREIVDVKRARLFKNIDHLTFIDDYRPLGTPNSLRDELNPEQNARPIFEWIKQDLLENSASKSAHDG